MFMEAVEEVDPTQEAAPWPDLPREGTSTRCHRYAPLALGYRRSVRASLGIFVAMFASCHGGGGNGPPPIVPLPFERIEPAPLADAVDPGARLSITFTEPLEPSSVGADALSADDGHGLVPGRVEYDAATRRLTLVPTRSLGLDAIVVARLAPTVRTAAGRTLAPGYEWTFTTRPGSWRTTAPIDSTETYPSWIAPERSDTGRSAIAVEQVVLTLEKGASEWRPMRPFDVRAYTSTRLRQVLFGPADDLYLCWQGYGFVPHHAEINVSVARPGGAWESTELRRLVHYSVYVERDPYAVMSMTENGDLLVSTVWGNRVAITPPVAAWFSPRAQGPRAWAEVPVPEIGYSAPVLFLDAESRLTEARSSDSVWTIRNHPIGSADVVEWTADSKDLVKVADDGTAYQVGARFEASLGHPAIGVRAWKHGVVTFDRIFVELPDFEVRSLRWDCARNGDLVAVVELISDTRCSMFVGTSFDAARREWSPPRTLVARLPWTDFGDVIQLCVGTRGDAWFLLQRSANGTSPSTLSGCRHRAKRGFGPEGFIAKVETTLGIDGFRAAIDANGDATLMWSDKKVWPGSKRKIRTLVYE